MDLVGEEPQPNSAADDGKEIDERETEGGWAVPRWRRRAMGVTGGGAVARRHGWQRSPGTNRL